MSQPPSAFLVTRRDDGFGDVYPLQTGVTVQARPRADEQDDAQGRPVQPRTCGGVSRGGWLVRPRSRQPEWDSRQRRGHPRANARSGRSTRCASAAPGSSSWTSFAQLPEHAEGRAVADRAHRWHRNPQASWPDPLPSTLRCRGGRHDPRRGACRSAPGVSVLYRLALDMAGAATVPELCELVVDAMFRADAGRGRGSPGPEGRARTRAGRPPHPRGGACRPTTRSRTMSATRCSPPSRQCWRRTSPPTTR